MWLNSRMTPGTKTFRTGIAHECGHLFQRSYNWNPGTWWVDEGVADAVAWATVGDANFNKTLVTAWVPWINGLPTTLYSGFDAEEAYATSSLFIWIAGRYGASVLPRIYSANRTLTIDALENAAGAQIYDLYLQFAKTYWTTREDPMRDLNPVAQIQNDVDPLAPFYGTVQPVYHRIAADGGASFSTARPCLSSIAHAFDFDPPYLSRVGPDADLVIRSTGLTGGGSAWVYGIDKEWHESNVRAEYLASIVPSTPSVLVGKVGQWKSWRVVVINAGNSLPVDATIRLVVPRITELSPSSGSPRGGYPVRVRGAGLGTAPGEARISGFPTQTSSWSDTEMEFVMPDLGTASGVWQVQVTTAEGARTNPLGFTFQ